MAKYYFVTIVCNAVKINSSQLGLCTPRWSFAELCFFVSTNRLFRRINVASKLCSTVGNVIEPVK
jgi:hypothetical protein